jgi:hypothetical protein
MSNEVTNYQPGAVELTMSRTTGVVLKEAEQAASALMKIVNERKLFKQIGSKRHLFVEAWETVGHFYRCHARVVDVIPMEIGPDYGWRAQADLVHMDTGHVLSTAFAFCMTDEADWRERPKYKWVNGERIQDGMEPVSHHARASMAQTRARSKVFRGVFDVVAVLAGYDPTPAEEMGGNGGTGKPTVQQPQRKQPGPGVISEAQRKRLYAMSKKAAWTNEEMHALLAEFSYESSNDVEKKNYEAICNRVEAGDKPTTQNTTPNEAEKSEAGQWRLHFTAADQPKIEAWLKGEHELTGDDLIDLFFRDTWQDDPSDALDAAVHWLGKQPSQGKLGV